MESGSWVCLIMMAAVSIAIFYVLMSIATHPDPNRGFMFITVGNLMYLTAFLLAIIGVCLYLYSFQRTSNGCEDHNCKIISLFYLLTLIGIVGISWLCFNYELSRYGVFGILLIIIGLLIFASS